MYGMDKKAMRLKAMDKMMKDKPMFGKKRPPMLEQNPEMVQMQEDPEDMMDQGSDDGMEEMGMMGDKGMVSMPVSPEEKMMILKMRKHGGMV